MSAEGESKGPAPAGTAPVPVARLFRRIDWLTFLVTFAAVWIGYYLTLAPEVTLEDSGELATGSFYAGIPHPPGYPVWTIYTWLWTVLVPFKNVAWRVALGEATSGALAAGLLGLLVSRGSSLLMEGIEELKAMAGQWERGICLVSGFVAGMLLGYNGFMWSQSVIVEVYSFSLASFMVVLLFLLRWIYAPQQVRYLCLALFFHGVCFTNHQTLIVAAIGIEVAIAAASFKLGRELWLANTIVYLCGLILSAEHILTTLESNHAIFVIYHVVGICSLLAFLWFCFLTRPSPQEVARSFCEAALFMSVAAMPALKAKAGFIAYLLVAASAGGWILLGRRTWKLGWEWLLVLVLGVCWIAGASFYFYMPLAGMTNPPMEWGYPRTVDGFLHAFTRGQYEKTNPSDIFHHPGVFLTQLVMLGRGITDEFNWVYAFLALVPFIFFFKLHRRERAWLIGITAIYLCLGVLLLILLNPPPDRAAQELVRVFFTASHTLIAIMVGYGLTLIAAYMATHYQEFRMRGLLGGAVAVGLALLSFASLTQDTYFGELAPSEPSRLMWLVGQSFVNSNQYGLPIYAGLILVAICAGFVAALWFYRQRAPLAIVLGLFAIMPVHSILTHWADNEQRNHWFGYWFGHDMFTPPFKGKDAKPLYPEMARNAVLFGGTDPGRFCPTYMIFCDSFIPHKRQPAFDQSFDRRDVYLITQNALADGTYLEYIRAQYFRSAQVDSPFFSEFARLLLHDSPDETNALARAMKPVDDFFTGYGAKVEKKRRTGTSWFKDEDFTPAFLSQLDPERVEKDPVSGKHFVTNNPVAEAVFHSLSAKTLAELQEARPPTKGVVVGLRSVDESVRTSDLPHDLAMDLNALLERPLYTPERFKDVQLSDYLQDFIKQNPQGFTRIRLNRLLLEAAFPELPRSLGGVYPDREIYTPSPEDLSLCINQYMADAQRRLALHQLKPGEVVSTESGGRIQISGQVTVMMINALLTKVIFDHNPKNEFYVEESFPLDWMYPYLTPFGIIMKVNRQPVRELPEDVVQRDHEFWSQYSQRMIGNWITYDTSLQDIAAWVRKVYLRHNFTGFTGERAFIRDDQAQKSFSKLRSAIGGVYVWRVQNTVKGTPEHTRALKEADFAFRQSFALCPYSPDVISRYVNLLISPEVNRFDDALVLARTMQELDPFNGFASGLVKNLQDWKAQQAGKPNAVHVLEQQLRANPADFQAAFNLAGTYLQAGDRAQGLAVLDGMLNNPKANAPVYRTLLQAYGTLNDAPRVQQTEQKLATEFQSHPTDLEAGIGLAEAYHMLGQTELENQTLDQVLSRTNVDARTVLAVAEHYAALTNLPRVETTMEKLVTLAPQSAEAWYNLASIKAALGKAPQAIDALRKCFEITRQKLKQDPKAPDFIKQARTDARFESLRNLPEFKTLVGE